MAAAYLERMGQRIRLRREQLGLSRPEVARAMPGKTTENQIYRWEKGLHRPQDDALEALAKVLDVGVTYFLASEDDEGRTPDPFAGPLDERIARIERELREQGARYAGLIEKQNDLLAEQSAVLKDIRAATSAQRAAAENVEAATRLMEEAGAMMREEALRPAPETDQSETSPRKE